MGEDKFTISLSDLDLIDDTMPEITLTADEWVNDSGSEYTYNIAGHPDSFGDYKVFVDTMPNINQIDDMCKHYPALAKAYENFKTIYKIVEQDYKGNHEDTNDIPF